LSQNTLPQYPFVWLSSTIQAVFAVRIGIFLRITVIFYVYEWVV